MIISEFEFEHLTKKFNVQWRPIEDSEISVGKSYIISDKQFIFKDKEVNVLEVLNGMYRVVSTRLSHKGKPYLNFNVASTFRKKKQKSMLLHRARLIAFFGEDPANPIARHGSLGQHNNDLNNLSWGTHDDNMNDAIQSGVHKGTKNAQAKISSEQALAIYILSNLDLIDDDIMSKLPIGKVSVSSIKAKRKWGHVVSDGIEQLVIRCKDVQSKKLHDELNKREVELRRRHEKEVADYKRIFKSKLKDLISKI